jgi:DNA primase
MSCVGGWALGKDWKALTAQIREANDIVALIGAYVQLQPAGTSYKGLCPFHSDHKPSLQVDPKWQNYRCWACGKRGDVFTFVMEFEKVDFREARAMLARRAGISLDTEDSGNSARLQQLDSLRWAADQFHRCLLDAPIGESARVYLGERALQGEIVRRFTLGYAPLSGDWLIQKAKEANVPLETLEEVGLIARSSYGSGWYDRFRDRVMFPVRSASGQIVGFGGRTLPGSPLADKAPKYYNSPESPVFSKSDLIYGVDQARQAGAKVGYLAVVEGYTDVLMAHQHGVPQVVATMGTALTARHIRQLRRYVPRVVLVFDADAGGDAGVDRALELFVSENVELSIAALPAGLDPCDFLIVQGAGPFEQALESAVDALDYKLRQMIQREAKGGIEGQRRVIDTILGVISRAPQATDQAAQVKRDLMLTRISHRLGVQETTIRHRLKELRARSDDRGADLKEDAPKPRHAPAPSHERELVQLLLAEPTLVPGAMKDVTLDEISHPGIQQMVRALYNLQEEGDVPDFDGLRLRLEDPALVQAAMELMDLGRASVAERATWLAQVVAAFRARRAHGVKQQLKSQLTAISDHETGVELLRRLQSQTVGTGP